MFTERITANESICNGKPTIRGMAITVATIIEFILAGESWDIILENYPTLEYADLEACIKYTLEMVNHTHTIRPVSTHA